MVFSRPCTCSHCRWVWQLAYGMYHQRFIIIPDSWLAQTSLDMLQLDCTLSCDKTILLSNNCIKPISITAWLFSSTSWVYLSCHQLQLLCLCTGRLKLDTGNSARFLLVGCCTLAQNVPHSSNVVNSNAYIPLHCGNSPHPKGDSCMLKLKTEAAISFVSQMKDLNGRKHSIFSILFFFF